MAKVRRRHPTKTTRNTDALTGALLTYGSGTVQRTLPDDDRIFYPHGDPAWLNGYRVALPLRLHTRTPSGRLGGPAFGRRTWKYLASEATQHSTLEHRNYEERFWWTPPWAERELRAFYDAELVDVVLAVVRDGQSWDDATRGVQRSISECKVGLRDMRRHCQRVLRQDRAA